MSPLFDPTFYSNEQQELKPEDIKPEYQSRRRESNFLSIVMIICGIIGLLTVYGLLSHDLLYSIYMSIGE